MGLFKGWLGLVLCVCHLVLSCFSVGCSCLLLLVFFFWSFRLFSSWLVPFRQYSFKFPSFSPPPPERNHDIGPRKSRYRSKERSRPTWLRSRKLSSRWINEWGWGVSRASLRFEKRRNFSINPRKLPIVYRYFSSRMKPKGWGISLECESHIKGWWVLYIAIYCMLRRQAESWCTELLGKWLGELLLLQ